jgi:hypothetical protein
MASKAAKAKAATLFIADLDDLAKVDKIDAATEQLALEIEEARAAQPEIFAPDNPPAGGGSSRSAEFEARGPHPFGKIPAANDNDWFLADAEAAEVPLQATGTGDVVPGKTVGEVKVTSQTGPDPITMAKTPQNQNIHPAPVTTPPPRTVEEFKQKHTVKEGKYVEPPQGVTAQPKAKDFEKQRAEQIDSADEAQEVASIHDSKTPKGIHPPVKAATGNFAHNDLPRYLDYFRRTGKAKEAAELERILNWPEGVEPNFKSFEMSDGRRGIPDAFDRVTGEVFELKPDTNTAWAKSGPYQAREYAEQMNREAYLGRRDWHAKPLTYKANDLEKLLRDRWGFLAKAVPKVASESLTELVHSDLDKALGKVMTQDTRAAFDARMKSWARAQIDAGQSAVTLEKFLNAIDEAAHAIPELRGRAMSDLVRKEAHEMLGLSASDEIPLGW